MGGRVRAGWERVESWEGSPLLCLDALHRLVSRCRRCVARPFLTLVLSLTPSHPVPLSLHLSLCPPLSLSAAAAVRFFSTNKKINATQSEEEALTARIIHYFSLGVLQLPDGTTLRAYLAQKLDCDPMRITKKFTGTNCLGKRVYHSCERTTATYEVAKQAVGELAELEARFQARLERNKEKRTGILGIEVSQPPAFRRPSVSTFLSRVYNSNLLSRIFFCFRVHEHRKQSEMRVKKKKREMGNLLGRDRRDRRK